MSIQTLHYNPFALNTAHAAWNDKKKPTSKRLLNTVKGALKDFYVKNPYDLTIGNMKYFFSSHATTNSDKITCIAVITISSCYSLILYGSTTYLSGRSFSALGKKLDIPLLSKVGQPIQIAGENIFLTGAVPIYAAAYALPKKIIEIIPKALYSIIKKTYTIAQWTFSNILMPIWNKVFLPLLQTTHKVIYYIKDVICNMVLTTTLWITKIANWTFQNLLQPIWNYLIKPVTNLIFKTFSSIALNLKNSFYFIFNKITQLADWTFNNVLYPLWNHFIEPTINLISKTIITLITTFASVVKYLANKTLLITNWIIQNILEPIWNNVFRPLTNVISSIFNTIANTFTTTYKTLFDHIIQPVGKALYFVSQKIGSFAQKIFHNLIVPIAKTIGKEFTILSSKIHEMSKKILEGIYLSWKNLFPNHS
jgi:hypothetical protein